MQHKNKGFTLIELLIVIAMIGILSGVILISLRSAKDRAEIAKSLAFDTQIYRKYMFTTNDTPTVKANWNFDGNTTDASGNSSTVIRSGGVIFSSDLNNSPNKSLSFPGTPGGSATANIPNLTTVDNITVSVWIYPIDFDPNLFNESFILRMGGNTNYNRWALRANGYDLQWTIGSFNDLNGLDDERVHCVLPSLNKWHQIIATQSGQRGALYIDGVLCGSNNNLYLGNITGPIDSSLSIGCGLSFLCYKGKVDGVRIYSKSILDQ